MSEVTEIWKDVIGFEGIYQVSNFSRVKSLDKLVPYRNGSRAKRKEVVLKPGKGRRKTDYLSVTLSKEGKSFHHKLHRIVMIAFTPNPENKPCVNHIDGNRLNNMLNNLEWCTQSENVRHAVRTGLQKSIKGRADRMNEFHHQSKPIIQIDINTGEKIKEWPSIAEARRQGYWPTRIVLVLKGRAEQAYGFKWVYKERA